MTLTTDNATNNNTLFCDLIEVISQSEFNNLLNLKEQNTKNLKYIPYIAYIIQLSLQELLNKIRVSLINKDF